MRPMPGNQLRNWLSSKGRSLVVSSDTAQETVPIDRYSSPWRYSVLRLGRGYLMDSYSGRWDLAATSSAEPLRLS